MDGSSIDDASVARFVESTSSDVEQAKFFLEACGGNFDRAIEMYRENTQPPIPRPRTSNQIPPRPRPPARQLIHANAPVPIQLARAIISLPFVVLHSSVRLAARTLGIGFSVFGSVLQHILPPRASQAIQNATRAIANGLPEETPTAAAANFIRNFTTTYGDTGPTWQPCGWQEAATRAHTEGKFLFIYLHSARHQDTDTFCRDTLCSPDLARYIQASFVSWGGDLRSADALRLASSLRVTGFPYCALLAFSGPRTRLLGAVEMAVTADELSQVLVATAVEHGGLLWEERAQREQMDMDRLLREEQDAEYQRSLEADRERERLAEEARIAAGEQERARRAAEEAEAEAVAAAEKKRADLAAALERRRNEKKESLPEEPPMSPSLEAAAGEGGGSSVALVRVRLPSGAMHQRRFMSTYTLQIVVDWVDSLDSHEHLKYRLAMTYPRRLFGEESWGKSLEELGLAPQAVLLVQPEDED